MRLLRPKADLECREVAANLLLCELKFSAKEFADLE